MTTILLNEDQPMVTNENVGRINISFDNLPEYFPLEVRLEHPDDFLKVRETLTRIGIASEKTSTLFQSCHILHKQGRYYIVHFKELFALDGRPASFDLTDFQRRNTIAKLLVDFGLISLVNPEPVLKNLSSMRMVKVLTYKDKEKWNLQTKYTIGRDTKFDVRLSDRKYLPDNEGA